MYSTIIEYSYTSSGTRERVNAHAVLTNPYGHPMEGSVELEGFDIYFRAPGQGMSWTSEVYEKGSDDEIDPGLEIKIRVVAFPQ